MLKFKERIPTFKLLLLEYKATRDNFGLVDAGLGGLFLDP